MFVQYLDVDFGEGHRTSSGKCVGCVVVEGGSSHFLKLDWTRTGFCLFICLVLVRLFCNMFLKY